MKKLTVLAILFLLWYVAGMYRNGMLMVLVVCASFVILSIAILTRFVIRPYLDIKIPAQNRKAYKNVEKLFCIKAVNKGFLPVNKLIISFEMCYKNDKKKFKKKFFGSASANESENNKASESDMEFYFTAPYCGVINIKLKKVKIFDWLSIFSCKKNLKTDEDIYILPIDREIRVSMPPIGSYSGEPITLTNSEKNGSDFSEIRLIREYRPGDLYRHLHRNYSARTDSLWIKEYKKENDFVFDFVFDTSSENKNQTVEHMDAFYDIGYNILAALVKNEAIIRIHWYNKEKGILENIEAENINQIDELMTRLYSTDTNCTYEEINSISGNIGNETMIFNSNLEWSFMDKAIFSFSEENFENELSNNLFVI